MRARIRQRPSFFSAGATAGGQRTSLVRPLPAASGRGEHGRARAAVLALRRGFTLIELMIVVAIIGILAAIAIPNYQLYVMRSKQTEVMTMLSAIHTAEFTNLSLFDCFAVVAANPPAAPGTTAQQWNYTGTGPATMCPPPRVFAFEDISVRPTRPTVYYQYSCNARAAVVGSNTDDFACSAYGDLDGDGFAFEEIYCTDQGHTGTCIPTNSPLHAVSLFPDELQRVSPGVF